MYGSFHASLHGKSVEPGQRSRTLVESVELVARPVEDDVVAPDHHDAREMTLHEGQVAVAGAEEFERVNSVKRKDPPFGLQMGSHLRHRLYASGGAESKP